MKISLAIAPYQLDDKYGIQYTFSYVVKDEDGKLATFDMIHSNDAQGCCVVRIGLSAYQNMLISYGAVGTMNITPYAQLTYFDDEATAAAAIEKIKTKYPMDNIIDPYTHMNMSLDPTPDPDPGTGTGTTTGSGVNIWTTATNYKLNDLVIHDKSLYLCVAAHKSALFSNEESNWKRIDADKVPAEWKTNKQYNADDLVVKDNIIYLCIAAHKSGTFTTDAANWKEIGAGKTVSPWVTAKEYDVNDIVIKDSSLYLCSTKHTSGVFATDISNWKKLGGDGAAISEWEQNKVYKINDFVTKDMNLYQCIYGHTAIDFTKDYQKKYWKKVAYKEDGTLIDVWQSGEAYTQNQVVINNGDLYLCTTSHTSGVFTNDTANWKKVNEQSSTFREWKAGDKYVADEPFVYNGDVYLCPAAYTAGVFADDLKANKFTKVSGIVDLKSFTTNDLADTTNRRYCTDNDKNNLSKLTSIVADQLTNNNAIKAIQSEIPTNASSSNQLATAADVASKIKAVSFATLPDTTSPLVPNSFVMIDNTGKKLNYITSLDKYTNIKKITDKDKNDYLNVPFVTFKDLAGNVLSDGTVELTLKDLYSTTLKDMPAAYDDGKILVANQSKMAYELKDVGSLTNSKANFSTILDSTKWTTVDGKAQAIVEHKLNSSNLVVAFYDADGNSKSLKYKVIDDNQIVVYGTDTNQTKCVINCSQGTVGGAGTTSSASVTASDFIDDTRMRLDKTLSSQKITATLGSYALKTNVYNKSESDARYSLKGNEHVHTNLTTLNKISEDLNGNIMYDGKALLTKIEPYFYEQHYDNQTETDLNMILNIADVMQDKKYITINSSEFTIKNLIIATGTDDDKDDAHTLHLQVIDGSITVLDVTIEPQEVQKYILGISPNIKIFVKGNFDANYYLTAF